MEEDVIDGRYDKRFGNVGTVGRLDFDLFCLALLILYLLGGFQIGSVENWYFLFLLFLLFSMVDFFLFLLCLFLLMDKFFDEL